MLSYQLYTFISSSIICAQNNQISGVCHGTLFQIIFLHLCRINMHKCLTHVRSRFLWKHFNVKYKLPSANDVSQARKHPVENDRKQFIQILKQCSVFAAYNNLMYFCTFCIYTVNLSRKGFYYSKRYTFKSFKTRPSNPSSMAFIIRSDNAVGVCEKTPSWL